MRKLQFKDANRVFWFITYEMLEDVHHIRVRCEEWGPPYRSSFTIAQLDESGIELSNGNIMMEIANLFSNYALRFAGGKQDVREVNSFDDV